MSIEQRIKTFNRANPPFYLVEHDDGTFSLCLAFSFLRGKYAGFGQDAFNQYAKQIGEPVKEDGFYTHGNGYEWESVFKKAFEKTPNISKIRFDCEAGGFFCYSRDLSVLEDLGSQFRKICLDKNGFAELVCTALEEAVIQDEEEKQCLTM